MVLRRFLMCFGILSGGTNYLTDCSRLSVRRFSCSLVGLVFLYRVGVLCYGSLCENYPLWALVGYHMCTSIPVVLQSVIHLVRAVTNLKRYKVYSSSRQGEVITREDYYHLLGKEIGRLVIVGVGTTLAIGFMPKMIFDTQLVFVACFICVFAYVSSNWIYNLMALAVTRTLIMAFGKYWLIEYG